MAQPCGSTDARSPRDRGDDGAVEVVPSDAVKRHAATWDGVTAEIVQATKHESIEYRFARRAALAVYEQGVRRDGDTLVEGCRDPLRSSGKLTFVPAGHEYSERQEPRILTSSYFYLDPDRMPMHPASEHDAALAPTLLRRRCAVGHGPLSSSAWSRLRPRQSSVSEPLVVLAHELVRLNAGVRRIHAPVRGGLAPWQQRIVTTYIEEHLGWRADIAREARPARRPEHVLFLPGVQTIPRNAAASISQQSAHRAGQDIVV